MGIGLIFVTLGPNGTFYRQGDNIGRLNTYDVKVVDTTGAGDAFMGSILYQLKGKSREDLAVLNSTEIEKMVDFANAAGALTTTKKGAILAVPTKDEILSCMANTARVIL